MRKKENAKIVHCWHGNSLVLQYASIPKYVDISLISNHFFNWKPIFSLRSPLHKIEHLDWWKTNATMQTYWLILSVWKCILFLPVPPNDFGNHHARLSSHRNFREDHPSRRSPDTDYTEVEEYETFWYHLFVFPALKLAIFVRSPPLIFSRYSKRPKTMSSLSKMRFRGRSGNA